MKNAKWKMLDANYQLYSQTLHKDEKMDVARGGAMSVAFSTYKNFK